MILTFCKVNEVTQFMYSRPFKRASGAAEEENEFACLWIERTILRTSHQLPGILRWFPVINTEVGLPFVKHLLYVQEVVTHFI